MARTKPTSRSRTLATWTTFRLSNDQDLAQQTSRLAGQQRSILSRVPGFTDARVGQRHGHPEQGAFVIWWETEESIRAFYDSEAYGQYLHNLGCAPEAPFLLFKEVSLGNIMRNFNGLVTLTKLLPAPEVGSSLAFQDALHDAFKGWMPKGCDRHHGLLGYIAQTWASASFVGGDDALGLSSSRGESDKVLCHIFGWDMYDRRSPERNLAAAVDPMARASWVSVIEKADDMVQSWEQEVWKFETLPSVIEPGTAQ